MWPETAAPNRDRRRAPVDDARAARGRAGVRAARASTTCRSGRRCRTRGIRLVGVRHEQTAVYAADGYARATGRLGVALVTTGPGAANTLGATGEAMASGSPGARDRHRHPGRAAPRRASTGACCTRRAIRRRCSSPVTQGRAPGRARGRDRRTRCPSAARRRWRRRAGRCTWACPTDLLDAAGRLRRETGARHRA